MLSNMLIFHFCTIVKEINLRFFNLNSLKKIMLTAGYLKNYAYLCGNKLIQPAHFDIAFQLSFVELNVE